VQEQSASLSPQPQHGCDPSAIRGFCEEVVSQGFSGLFCFAEFGDSSRQSELPSLLARAGTRTADFVSNLRDSRTLSAGACSGPNIAPHSYSKIADDAETFSYLSPATTQTLMMHLSPFGRPTHVIEAVQKLVGTTTDSNQRQQAVFRLLAEGPPVIYTGSCVPVTVRPVSLYTVVSGSRLPSLCGGQVTSGGIR
jgi:hypothetical protein